MTTIKITYDRREALFTIVEDTEHGGRAESRATLATAANILTLDAPLYDIETRVLNALHDGRIRSITLEV